MSLNETAVAISSIVSFPQEYKAQPFPGVSLKPVGEEWLQFLLSLLENKEVFFVCHFGQPWLHLSPSVAL